MASAREIAAELENHNKGYIDLTKDGEAVELLTAAQEIEQAQLQCQIWLALWSAEIETSDFQSWLGVEREKAKEAERGKAEKLSRSD
jgi:hypothetical protein